MPRCECVEPDGSSTNERQCSLNGLQRSKTTRLVDCRNGLGHGAPQCWGARPFASSNKLFRSRCGGDWFTAREQHRNNRQVRCCPVGERAWQESPGAIARTQRLEPDHDGDGADGLVGAQIWPPESGSGIGANSCASLCRKHGVAISKP